MVKDAPPVAATPSAGDRASAVDAVLLAGALAAAACVCASPLGLQEIVVGWALLASLGLPLLGALLACDRLPAVERPARRPLVWTVVALLAGGVWGAVTFDLYPAEARRTFSEAALAVLALATTASVALAAVARTTSSATWPVLALWLAATYGLVLRTGLGRGGDPPIERVLLVAGGIAALAAPLISWVCRTLGGEALRWGAGRGAPTGWVWRPLLIGLGIGGALLPAWSSVPIAGMWGPVCIAGAAAPILLGALMERRGREGLSLRMAVALLSAATFGVGFALGVLGSGRLFPADSDAFLQTVAFVGLLAFAPYLSVGGAAPADALWPCVALTAGLTLARTWMEPTGDSALASTGNLAAAIAWAAALPLLTSALRSHARPPGWNLLRSGGVAVASMGLAAGAFVMPHRFGMNVTIPLSFAAALLVGLGALMDRRPDLRPQAEWAEELALGGNWLLGLALAPWAHLCSAGGNSPFGPTFAFPVASTLAARVLLPALLASCLLAAPTLATAFWNALILGEGALLGALVVDATTDRLSLPGNGPLVESVLLGLWLVPALYVLLHRRFGVRPLAGLGLATGLLVLLVQVLGVLLLHGSP